MSSESKTPTDTAAKDPPPAAAAAAAAASSVESTAKAKKPAAAKQSLGLDGEAIGRVLQSSGPVVKAVLLRHMRKDGKDGKPHIPSSPKHNGGAAEEDHLHHRVVLTEDIEEIDLDTTPSKNAVKTIMGGPFTFLGQFHTEGTMVIARRDLPDDLPSLSISQLRELCDDLSIDTKPMIEKSELVNALEQTQLPINPHRLQPPLDKVVARGDILILKVAETEEVLDEAAPDGQKEKTEKDITLLSNDDFFLNYTKEEYVDFASRTDVVAPPHEPGNDDEDEEADDDDEEESDDEDFVLGEDECEEEERQGMLNLLMGGVLKKFREENGRGPSTEELLELRKHVADQLGVEVATFEALEKEDAEEDEDKKRKADDLDTSQNKRVKFSQGDEDEEEDKDGEGKEEKEDPKIAAAVTEDKNKKSES